VDGAAGRRVTSVPAATLPRLDVHQHLWPEPFVAALARRREPPALRRTRDGFVLRLAGEAEALLELASSDPAARRATLAADGVDRALLCLSSPLGIEALPADEAHPLLEAWHEGVLALGEPFGVWGALALDDAAPADVRALLERGVIGLSLPAGALSRPERVERLGPALAELQGRDRPLLVHPGPAPAGVPPAPWWPPSVSYVADLHAAWHGFAAWARPDLPRLRVVFVALAGGAPLHIERLAARGGPVTAAFDPLTFYDTSSYGPRAVEAIGGVVGVDALVHGSDRPLVDAPAGLHLGAAADHALTAVNPARLLTGTHAGAGHVA
jgi:6-methylsalicylate decarboxylase